MGCIASLLAPYSPMQEFRDIVDNECDIRRLKTMLDYIEFQYSRMAPPNDQTTCHDWTGWDMVDTLSDQRT